MKLRSYSPAARIAGLIACLVLSLAPESQGQRLGKGARSGAGLNRQVNQQWQFTSQNFAARTSSVSRTDDREGKSLVNVFPFNAQNAHSHSHSHDHHEAHENAQQRAPQPVNGKDSRTSRQGVSSSNTPLDIGTIAAAGERCVEKVVMEQVTEVDEEIHCKHSYSKKCHITYATNYKPEQEEECQETFTKKCFIEYKKAAIEEKVKFCFTPLVRNCDLPSPIECNTEYRSECTTRYHEHDVEDDVPNCVEEFETRCEQVTQGYTTNDVCSKWPVKKCNLQTERVKKYSPETECKKRPFELCGPAACPVVPGEEECHDRSETIIQEVPEETCSLEPQRECKHVTKLVPSLTERENCLDIPKEVCGRRRTNPRKVSKPVIKKWCYTPSPESGLPSFTGNSPGDSSQGTEINPTITQRPPIETGCLAGYPVDYCPSRSNNRRCDPECNTPACGYDNNECRVVTTPRPQGCLPGYPVDYCPSRSNNRRCDPECNTPACGYDNNECRVVTTPRPQGCLPGYPVDYCPSRSNNRRCDPECNTPACGYDNNECRVVTTPRPQGCLPGYPVDYCPSRRNNGVCDQECNISGCSFDGGDCTLPQRPDLSYLPPPPTRKGY